MSPMKWPPFVADNADRGTQTKPKWITLTMKHWESFPHIVSVKVADLADGQTVIIGLRLDPNPNFDGNLREMVINPSGLAGFNWREAVNAVRLAEAYKPEPTVDDISNWMDVLDERDVVNDLGSIEVLVAKGQDADAKARLAAFLYREAMRRGEKSPRQFIADRIPGRDGEVPCSLDSVNNYLRRARDNGWLPAYEGGQAKHGLPEKTTRKRGGTQKGTTK